MKHIILLLVVLAFGYCENISWTPKKFTSIVEKKVTSIADSALTTNFTTQKEAVGQYLYRVEAECLISKCSFGVTTSAIGADATYITSGTVVKIGIVENTTMDTRKYIKPTKWNGNFLFRIFYGSWP